ncbi:hypothetical protein CPB85DRAFT_1317919 [Mucidula mucida]|nr:hypothetical protein CPB85DRAFT_1317919 [Mucidula mucida]
MGKARKTKLKEYKPPRTSHYIVVANPLPIGAGPSDARFHDNLGNWLEWLTNKKALSIYYLSKMSSVVVELPGQMTDDVAARLLGEHTLRNPRTGQAHYSQVFEYDYKKYGCPDEIQRCSRGSYSIAAPQKLELPRPRECAFNPNVRFAKPNPRREANEPPPPDHQQQQLDREPQEPEDDDRQSQLDEVATTLAPAESEQTASPPAPTSRWQPYETPLENRARVGSRAPDHDVFSSRVQTVRVKPEPMDVELPPPSAAIYATEELESHFDRDNSPEAGSAEYYQRALEEAEREVAMHPPKEEPQERAHLGIVKREPREETVPPMSFGKTEEEDHKPSIKEEPSLDSIPPSQHELASERQPSVKQEPRDSLLPPPSHSPRHYVKSEPLISGMLPPTLSGPSNMRRPRHHYDARPIKQEPRTRYSPSRDPRRSATVDSFHQHDSSRPGNERKRGHESTTRDGIVKRVKTEYEEY